MSISFSAPSRSPASLRVSMSSGRGYAIASMACMCITTCSVLCHTPHYIRFCGKWKAQMHRTAKRRPGGLRAGPDERDCAARAPLAVKHAGVEEAARPARAASASLRRGRSRPHGARHNGGKTSGRTEHMRIIQFCGKWKAQMRRPSPRRPGGLRAGPDESDCAARGSVGGQARGRGRSGSPRARPRVRPCGGGASASMTHIPRAV